MKTKADNNNKAARLRILFKIFKKLPVSAMLCFCITMRFNFRRFGPKKLRIFLLRLDIADAEVLENEIKSSGYRYNGSIIL